MNAFPIHCYEIYNEKGEQFYVRFKFLSELGYDSFTLKEARELGADDPDFFIRDLYNAIALGRAPAWRLHMDVLRDLDAADFDPFDVTRLWGNGTYDTVEVGRLVLDRNVDNHFAQVEQAAFNPNHLVPGIAGPRDQLFRGRILAYTGAQIHRLGVNNHKIPVNCPLRAATYNRDGAGPVGDNERDAPVYFPNSFHGPAPRVEAAAPARLVVRPAARAGLLPARAAAPGAAPAARGQHGDAHAARAARHAPPLPAPAARRGPGAGRAPAGRAGAPRPPAPAAPSR